jgi:hypothetical protein
MSGEAVALEQPKECAGNIEVLARLLSSGLESFSRDHGADVLRRLPPDALAEFSELLGVNQQLLNELEQLKNSRL